MKMRTLIILICFGAFLISCNDSRKEKDNLSGKQDTIEAKENLGTSAQDQPIHQDGRDQSKNKQLSQGDEKKNNELSAITSGTYLNTEHKEDTSCKCYCIEISTNGTSELCLKENEIYINARFEESGQNINIFYADKSSKTTAEEIPWDKFETGTPIAVLSPEPNGNLKLDWKGFIIDGKIAVDYALYGKKTLEGTYKKK